MSSSIDDENLLEEYKAIWTKIEDLKNIQLNALPVYDDRYIKTKIKTYDDQIYISFRGFNMPGDDIESEYFTVIYMDSSHVYDEKYYLQVFQKNFVYKVVDK